MYRPSTVEIRKTIHDPLPRIPFEHIARAILSERYELSLVICGDSLARRINRTYRPDRMSGQGAGKKSYAPNVLSFPLATYEGEIFLNVRKAEREARGFGIPVRTRLAHLFIHGCLHLTGHTHGTKMDTLEKKMLKSIR